MNRKHIPTGLKEASVTHPFKAGAGETCPFVEKKLSKSSKVLHTFPAAVNGKYIPTGLKEASF